MVLWSAFALLLTIAVGVFLFRWRVARRSSVLAASASGNAVVSETAIARSSKNDTAHAAIPFQTQAIAEIQDSIYKLAFGVARTDYRILGDHQQVLRDAEQAVAKAIDEPKYFPRKPALLPKLLRAINASDSSRTEIVRLILQDAVLAGNVLKRANSAFYRSDDIPIESVDRAVTILGSDGLRAPVATAVMQPVFRLPRGFFEQFAPLTWELAQRTALAAETYARIKKTGDEFVAHLLGLLGGLGRIVLFRMTLDKYREQPNIMPRAEVFIRTMKDHDFQITRRIAAAWEMSPVFLEAIDAQIAQTSPERMTPFARTLYYANLCGAVATLHRHNLYEPEAARKLLSEQAMDADTFATVWLAADGDID
jgi:HD-like signal output (HDOD) protein